jgi:hypothetical protein
MNRFCFTHSHRGSSRAYRMILAKHALDRDLHEHIDHEHGDCGPCWRDTALALADAANGLLLRNAGIPEMDGNGVVTGAGITWLLEYIDDLLTVEALDRGERERGA